MASGFTGQRRTYRGRRRSGLPSLALPQQEVSRRLAARGLFLSHGDFYAATVVERLELGAEDWCAPAAPATRQRMRSSELIEGRQRDSQWKVKSER